MKDLGVFKLIAKDFDLSDYQFVPLIYTFNVKFNCRRRARLFANGSVTIQPSEVEVWSAVVSIDTVCTDLLLGMLSNLKILAADISSA